jgi:hypothetical protein
MSSDESFLEQLALALSEVGLEAIIVGMAAAAVQGVPAMTEDVDLLVRDTALNRKKVAKLCERLGGLKPVKASELADVETLLGGAAPVDIVYDHLPGGLTFARVKAGSANLRIGKGTARVASLRDIIQSKKAANRPKDIAQLPLLESTLLTLEAMRRKK